MWSFLGLVLFMRSACIRLLIQDPSSSLPFNAHPITPQLILANKTFSRHDYIADPRMFLDSRVIFYSFNVPFPSRCLQSDCHVLPETVVSAHHIITDLPQILNLLYQVEDQVILYSVLFFFGLRWCSLNDLFALSLCLNVGQSSQESFRQAKQLKNLYGLFGHLMKKDQVCLNSPRRSMMLVRSINL